MKKIFGLTLSLLVLAQAAFTSCEDMLSPESDMVMYEEDNRLNTANDTLYSVIGVISLMQKVADRTNVLGEVRADLVTLTESASVDLQQLASFTAGEDNAYNNPQDYYAIINNCNYFIHTADSTYKKQGVKVFEKELAVMHTYRAWAYLQLCLNYGNVPFYTDFLGTQAKGEEVMRQPLKSTKEICDILIDDLKPWQNTRRLIYEGSINGYRSEQFTIPVKMMLGELCLWAERYQEAAQFYHDFLADVDNPHPVGSSYYIEWAWTSGYRPNAQTRIYDGYTYFHPEFDETLAFVPMEASAFNGVYSRLPYLYNSINGNDGYYEITVSESAVEQSAEQPYYLVYTENAERDTLFMGADTIVDKLSDRRKIGDLRLYSVHSISTLSSSTTDKYNSTAQSIFKIRNGSVVLYRNTVIWLHFAEALNRAGFPTAAFAVLKYGLSKATTADRNVGDPILASEREAAGTLLDFNQYTFTSENTIGIHSRGCGDVYANPEYEIPALANANDTMLWVEDKIVEELSLETIFEGQRYYDLMRVASRRGDASYLADRIATRDGKKNPNEVLRGLLKDQNNWYLPMRK